VTYRRLFGAQRKRKEKYLSKKEGEEEGKKRTKKKHLLPFAPSADRRFAWCN